MNALQATPTRPALSPIPGGLPHAPVAGFRVTVTTLPAIPSNIPQRRRTRAAAMLSAIARGATPEDLVERSTPAPNCDRYEHDEMHAHLALRIDALGIPTVPA